MLSVRLTMTSNVYLLTDNCPVNVIKGNQWSF